MFLSRLLTRNAAIGATVALTLVFGSAGSALASDAADAPPPVDTATTAPGDALQTPPPAETPPAVDAPAADVPPTPPAADVPPTPPAADPGSDAGAQAGTDASTPPDGSAPASDSVPADTSGIEPSDLPAPGSARTLSDQSSVDGEKSAAPGPKSAPDDKGAYDHEGDKGDKGDKGGHEAKKGWLKLVKVVVNDDGGDAEPGDWDLQAKIGKTWTTLAQGAYEELPAGEYELREVGGPEGYDQTSLVCVSSGHDKDHGKDKTRTKDDHGSKGDSVATVEKGEKSTCTFTNDDRRQPKKTGWLKLEKVVVNDDGGDAEPGDWDLQAFVGGAWVTLEQGEWTQLPAGSYAIRETGGVDGYAQVDVSCSTDKPHDRKDAVGKSAGHHDPKATVSHGKKTTCTFTNDDEAPPPPPVVTKDAVGATQLDADTWVVEYLLTVDNSAFGAVDRAYTLHDTLTSLPAGVVLDEATAEADTPATPAPVTASWSSVTPDGALLQDGATIAAGAEHAYEIEVTVTLSTIEAGQTEDCEGEPGIAVLNTAVLVVDGVESDDDACGRISYTDLGIEKTHSELEGGTVDPGQTFSYFLTVTNHGLDEAIDGVVSDPIPDGLTVDDVIVPEGWVDESEGSLVTVRIPSLAAGDSATIEVVVTVDEPDPITAPAIGPGDPGPAAPLDFIGDLVNEACVEIAFDGNPDNDCDTTTIQVDEIIANVFAQCVLDAPYLHYSVQTSPSLAGQPITLTWTPDLQTPAPDPAAIVLTLQSGDSGTLPWPGAAFAPNSVSIQWPGYRPLVASDYNPTTGALLVDPSLVYNGMVLDTTYPTYPWRFGTTLTISVNPTLTINASYPPATANCAVPRSAALVIDKTASVETTAPGASFTYGLAVTNLAVDSVAEPVVVTDIIPADIRVDTITTSTTAFPRWINCAVSGRDAAGFGGTLECTLLGPLAMSTSAPLISLGVTVAGQTRSTSIVNAGEVCWGPPASGLSFQACNDDSVTVRLSGLAATGAESPLGTLMAAAGAILAGGLLLGYRVLRRRRESA